MFTKNIITLVPIIALTVFLSSCVSTDYKLEPLSLDQLKKEYPIPSYKIGDQWTIKNSGPSKLDSLTLSITDIDLQKDIYIVEEYASIKSVNSILPSQLEVDRKTLKTKKNTFSAIINGINITVTENTVRSYPKGQPYPIKLGKEWETDITRTTKTTKADKSTIKKQAIKIKSVVSGIEDIQVPAGKFKCFRVDTYNNGAPIETYWISPRIKLIPVKNINHRNKNSFELQSFSLKQ